VVALPQAYAVTDDLLALVDEVAAARFGRTDLRGAPLVHAVQRLHAVYTAERARMPELAGDAAALCARLRFFLPRDLPKISAPLHELARVGALAPRRTWRVLDLGAGLGACTLGALEVLTAAALVDALHVDAVDVDGDALELARALCERRAQASGIRLTFASHTQRLAARPPAGLHGPYDLILLGFVLNELAHDDADPGLQNANVLRSLASLLASDGALIALEPALREPSRALQQARGHLIAGGGPPHVFAPCLHAGACPLLERERDWCHERLRVALPEPIAALARDAGLRAADLSYSYLTLCATPRSLSEIGEVSDLPSAPSTLLRVVSAPLPSKGKLELCVCADGPLRKLRLLDRHARAHGALLERVGRGSVLRVRDAELRGDALVVGASTEVSAL
jgi:ribosomal protein RSM22 (predicted rRNA methylase)